VHELTDRRHIAVVENKAQPMHTLVLGSYSRASRVIFTIRQAGWRASPKRSAIPRSNTGNTEDVLRDDGYTEQEIAALQVTKAI